MLLLSPVLLFAQGASSAPQPTPGDQFGGNYKGVAKSPDGDIALTLEIKSQNGKISGRLVTPQGEQSFKSGEVVDGALMIKLGTGGLSLKVRDGKVLGDWKEGAQSRAVEFRKVPAASEIVVGEIRRDPTSAGPSAAEQLSGEWDAAADVQGQAFPFTLTLKVDGEKVSGESSSQLGNSTISSGSFKDGKLAVIIESGNGQIALIGTFLDGKLVGDYDYSGQMQGKWVATKKKP